MARLRAVLRTQTLALRPDSRYRHAMTAPKEITHLIERFERNAEAYRSPGYNETQVRREFRYS